MSTVFPFLPAGPAAARIYLAKDHPAVRHGLGLVLGQVGLEVCGEGETVPGVFLGVGATHPDLVIVDLRLGEENGLNLHGNLHHRWPTMRLLVCSMCEDPAHVRQA